MAMIILKCVKGSPQRDDETTRGCNQAFGKHEQNYFFNYIQELSELPTHFNSKLLNRI